MWVISKKKKKITTLIASSNSDFWGTYDSWSLATEGVEGVKETEKKKIAPESEIGFLKNQWSNQAIKMENKSDVILQNKRLESPAEPLN